MLEKLFSRGLSEKHCIRQKKPVVDEILRRNLLLSDKIAEDIFVIVKTIVFGVDGSRLVLGLVHSDWVCFFPLFCIELLPLKYC